MYTTALSTALPTSKQISSFSFTVSQSGMKSSSTTIYLFLDLYVINKKIYFSKNLKEYVESQLFYYVY